MKVSFVIPNYNGEELLRKNLPAVQKAGVYYQKQTGVSFEIIVSDDGSKDVSEETIKRMPFPVTYLSHKKNTGFSTNVNRGISAASGDIIVLLNTDVIPKENFLISLLKHFADEKMFGVGCMDISIEGEKEIKRGRGVGTFRKGFLFHNAGKVDKDSTLWVSGGSSAFRRELFEKLGGFYSIYNPFYWEDIDLSYRACKSGYSIRFEPESMVIHEHDAGSIKTQFTKNRITAVAYRNQFFFVWINMTDTRFLWEHILWLPIHTVQAILRGDMHYLQGLVAALRKFPEVMKLRRQNKKLITVSDEHVLSPFS